MVMEDLMQSQIRDSCRLALPEGLLDLMSDISREVLRAQPPDLYHFIVSYLEAMLLARDTLCIACRVCRDVCKCSCHPELEEELRNLGLDGDDLETAKNVVIEYFDKDDVKEGNLLMKLFNKTDIDPNLLPAIQDAVRVAFQKHLRVHHAVHWVEAEKFNEVGQIAASHTLHFYDRVQDDKKLSWDEAANKIQAAFRGGSGKVPLDEAALKLRGKLAQIDSSNMILQAPDNTTKDETERASTSKPIRNNIVRLSLSSSSLAGSLINLPKYIPYSVHDMTYADFEEHEKERKNIDYTLETHFRDLKKEKGTKNIAFYEQHVLHEIKSCSIEEEGDIEEQLAEDIQSEAVSIDENIIEDKSVEDIEEEPESALDDNIDEGNMFIEDMVQEFVSYIDKTKNYIESNVYESAVNKTLEIKSTVDGMLKETLSHSSLLSDYIDIKKEFEGISFDGYVFEQKHHNDMTFDHENIEEGIEKEDLDEKRRMSNRADFKAHIKMQRTLNKKLITLSKTQVTDDKEQEEDQISNSSSD